MRYVISMHQLLPYVQFCASTLIQEALARALPKADLPYEGYSNWKRKIRIQKMTTMIPTNKHYVIEARI